MTAMEKRRTAVVAPLPAEETEVVVLGGGVGGLTSALYLSRAGLHPLVITGQNPGGALNQSPLVQNWPGEIGIRGGDLVDKLRNQAEESGASFSIAEVVKVDFSTNPYQIFIRDPLVPGSEKIIKTKACVIATGATPKMLGVPGESLFWLKGVHNCAVCDGNLYKEQSVLVVGGGDSAILEASYLAKFVKKVTLVVRSSKLKSIETKRKEQLLARPNVEILYNTVVKEINGEEGSMTNVVIKNTADGKQSVLPANALFLAIGSTPNTQLFKEQLDLDENGYILLVDQQQTSKSNIFAVGDVTDPYFRQAVTAAGDGAKAALQIERSLTLSPPEQKETTTDLVSNEHQVIAIKTLEHFEKEVLQADSPVLVDFYADWCGPCRMLEPNIQNWSKQFQGKVKFAKVNIDQLNKIAKRYSVRAVPTVLFFENGVLRDSRTGLQEIANLVHSWDTDFPE
jgi:thioredoxin reductase (NADPH)